ncbi:Ubiquitin-conjugating enzyme [Oryctes borbonicus]|uniref:Ubiquitin-conjugating enzyme E2 Z n=1 Tax=Oryctes borbonicus TaxID=1629725 RepID=A0A0T6BDZ4_9SCAR|nr:Ubiquitin-conjugating enzyme [Oryctes borbonicus]
MSKGDENNILYWDPMSDSEADSLTSTATARIKKDLMTLYTDTLPGIFAVGDEKNLKFIYALIIGPMNTPYQGGFFYFVLKCPNDYPIQPPRMRLLTTDGGRVRFNPNLYETGKICVSILGTWNGPAWSPAQQISSLLLTIQSLLNEKPYYNEPGFDKVNCSFFSRIFVNKYIQEMIPGDSDRYNEIITYQTLRVAVCGMVENDGGLNVPESLQNIMKQSFLNYYEEYLQTVESKLHLSGTSVVVSNCINLKREKRYDEVLF